MKTRTCARRLRQANAGSGRNASLALALLIGVLAIWVELSIDFEPSLEIVDSSGAKDASMALGDDLLAGRPRAGESLSVRGDQAIQRTPASAPVEASTDSFDGTAESAPFPQTKRFAQEAGYFLDSFTTENPDVIGWSALWHKLALDAAVIEDSIVEEDGLIRGSIAVGGGEATVDFEIDGDGYSLLWRDEAATALKGLTRFNASISFLVSGASSIEQMNGVVQLYPRGSQDFHRHGPVGHGYYVTDSAHNALPMVPVFKNGEKYGISIGLFDKKDETPGGYIEPAAAWYALLSRIK